MATRGRSTSDDGESDTKGETPTDLEDATKGSDTERAGCVKIHASNSGDSGED